MRSQTGRTIAGRVAANGTIAAGRDFAPIRSSLGAYQVNLPPDFRLSGVTVTAVDGGGYSLPTVTSQGATFFTYAVRNPNNNAPTDIAVGFTAVGVT